jgi:hypothetical protein
VTRFYRQQTCPFGHHKRLMLKIVPLLILAFIIVSSGCKVSSERKTEVLLAVTDASQERLLGEINRFARVNSMRAKMDLKFEDNSFAQFGSKEVYRSADGEVVVQRPGKISLKVQVPVVKVDVAQMTSDGEKFRVAVINAGDCAECKKFVIGTNNADYSKLQQNLTTIEVNKGKNIKQNVSAFANLRPQHFTDAILVRPTDTANVYLQSTIYQSEEDEMKKRVTRGYYLLDEYVKDPNGEMKITRRFWFDRVGVVRLARQQIFDGKGEIESDIVYGREGNLTNTGEYNNLPLRIQVTRPKEKYTMSLTYQNPENVTIGRSYNAEVFVLKNTWGLEEVLLDEKLRQANGNQSALSNQK